MTAEHARRIALAIDARDRAGRNLDNAAKMPERGEGQPGNDEMLTSAGEAYVEAQTALDDLLRIQPVSGNASPGKAVGPAVDRPDPTQTSNG